MLRKQKKRISKNIKKLAVMSKYDWEGTNYPSEKDDWKWFQKNNPTTALNALYGKKEKKDIPAIFQNKTLRGKRKLLF